MKKIQNIVLLMLLSFPVQGQYSAEQYMILAKNSKTSVDIITYCSKAIELDSNFSEAYLIRGITYQKNSDFKYAKSDFNNLIRIDTLDAEAYYLRAKVNWELNEITAAMKDINKALEIDKKFSQAYISRGIWKNQLESNIPAKSGNADLKKGKRLRLKEKKQVMD